MAYIPSITNVQTSGVQNSISNILTDSSMTANKLATGQRIGAPYEDPAGLAIGTKLGINLALQHEALKSANQASVAINIAYGGAKSIKDNLKRMNELSVMALTGSAGDNDRALINLEAQQLKREINRVADSTDFNGKKLIDGSTSLTIEVASSNAMSLELNFDKNNQAIFDGKGNKIFEVASGGKLVLQNVSGTGDKILDASGKEIYGWDNANKNIQSLDGAKIYFTIDDKDDVKDIKNAASTPATVLNYDNTTGKLTDGATPPKELYDFKNPEDKSNAMVFQVGSGADQKIKVGFGSTDIKKLGIVDFELGTVKEAEKAQQMVTEALDYMSKYISNIGAYQSRFKMVAGSIATSIENVDAARSQFMDADFTELTKELSQQKATLDAAIAAEAQLIQVPQKLIRLTQVV